MKESTMQISLFEVNNSEHLPNGWYGFEGSVCEDPECHCEKISISTIQTIRKNNSTQEVESIKHLATVDVIWAGGELSVEPFDHEDSSTTTKKVMAFVKDKIIGNQDLLEAWKIEYAFTKAEHAMNHIMQEISKENIVAPKFLQPKRNASCFCGSGKKYKKCCMLQLEHQQSG